MADLDAYFDAYDRVHGVAAREPDWKLLRKQVRRALVRPALQLGWRVLLLILFVTWGVLGHPQGYLLALGTVMAVIPAKIRELREGVQRVASLSGTEDLRRHLIEEARKRSAGVFVNFLFYSVIAVLFLLTGAIAGLVGKDFRPGVFAGLMMVALAAWNLFFRFPRTIRESAALGDEELEDDDEDDDDDE